MSKKMPPLSRLLFVLLLLSAGCAGDSGPTSPPTGNSDGTVVVDAGGGQLVSSQGDAIVTIDIPAGAVMSATEFTLRPIASTGRASFEVGPSGLFLREPVTITLEVPETWESPEAVGVSFGRDANRASVPVAYNASTRQITVQTQYLGFATDVSNKLGPMLPLDFNDVDCTIEVMLLMDRAANAQAWYTAGGYTSLVSEPLTVLAAQYEVANAYCEVDVASLQNNLGGLACQTYANALIDLDIDFPPDNQNDFEVWLQPLVAAEATKQLLGMGCGMPIEDALGNGIDRYIDRLRDRFADPAYLDDTPWAASWNEIRESSIELRGAAGLWGVTSAVNRVTDDLLPLQFEAFRVSAFNRAQEDNDQSYLADLISGGWLRNHPLEATPGVPWWADVTALDLIRDGQYAGSPLNVKAYDGLADLVADVDLGPGAAPGLEVDQVNLEVPYDGALDLLGPVRALTCYNGGATTFSDDPLVLRANGMEHAVLQSSPEGAFFATPYGLSMGELLVTAGLPEEPDQELELTVVRAGDGCGGQYGDGEFVLFTLDITTSDGSCGEEILAADGKLYSPCTLLVTLEYPDRVWADEFYDLVVQATTPDGDPAVGAEVALGTNEGEFTFATGVTDADGLFLSSAKINPNWNELEITAQVTAETGAVGEGTDTALRHNQIVLLDRYIDAGASTGFYYRRPGQSVVTSVYSNFEALPLHFHTLDPLNETYFAVGSGSAYGTTSEGEATVDHDSDVSYTGDDFAGCYHQAEINADGSLQDPSANFELYRSSAGGSSRITVTFEVWGDPATFDLNFTASADARTSLYGPGIDLCYIGNGECPPPDEDDDKSGPGAGLSSSRRLGGAQGLLEPGRYLLRSSVEAGVLFTKDGQASGSGTVTAMVDLTFSVTHP